MVLHRRKRGEVAGVGELVDDEDVMVGGGNGMPHEGGADKSCPSCHQKTLPHQVPVPANAVVCPFFPPEMRVQRRPTVNTPARGPQPPADAALAGTGQINVPTEGTGCRSISQPS